MRPLVATVAVLLFATPAFAVETCPTTTKAKLYADYAVMPREIIDVPKALETVFFNRMNTARAKNTAPFLDVNDLVIFRPRDGARYAVILFKDDCLVPLVNAALTIDGLRVFFNILGSDDVMAFIEGQGA